MAVDQFGEPLIDPDVLKAHSAYVAGENAWQQRARLLQSLWRADHGWPAGSRAADYRDPRAKRLGSRLAPDQAAVGANFLTPMAWARAQHEMANKERGALMKATRLTHDLLSSQPLCFNLFAELDADHELATRVLADLLPALAITGLTARDDGRSILFEHSPGRGLTAYGGDRSAFDVAIPYQSNHGPGLLGIEVKYHENLAKPDRRPPSFAGWFPDIAADHQADLLRPPLVQLARDHRLARAVARQDTALYPAGVTWILLAPAGNTAVARAMHAYQALLPDASDLAFVTLDDAVEACTRHSDQPWPQALRGRYLDTGRAARLGAPAQHPAPEESGHAR